MSPFEADLRRLRQDERNPSLPGLLATYAGLIGLVGLGLWGGPMWLPLLIFPIGVLQYRVVLSGHEAVHKTLCYPLWLNELLGVLGQALVGVNFASYRVQHLDHHRATTLAADPDGHIYGGIIQTPRGWRRWTVYVLGTFIEIAVKVYQKGIGSIGTRHSEASRVNTIPDSRLHTVGVLGAQSALLLGFWALTGHWWAYLCWWIAPLFAVAVFLNRSRILVEHGLALLDGQNSTPRGIPTVDIWAPAWQRFIFSPFNFNHHNAHHLHMTVPHYNLPELAKALDAHQSAGFHPLRISYLTAIARAMAA